MQKVGRQTQLTAPSHAIRESHRTRNSTALPAHPAAGYTGNQATLRRLSQASPQVRYKLEIGAVNDPLEAEADRVADQVMRMTDPAISSTDVPHPLRRKRAACEERRG